MQAAAWLHDTVEDGHTTLAEIAFRCGPEVAALVDALTRCAEIDGLHSIRLPADAIHAVGKSFLLPQRG